MRQIKIGVWPAVAFPFSVVEWGGLRKHRDAGRDPPLERKTQRQEKQIQAIEAKEGVYTVAKLVEDYSTRYVVHHRIPANAKSLASGCTVALRRLRRWSDLT